MYEALTAAGLDITEEGVLTLFSMIDEDGNGDIDRDEWKETIEFYLELKEEEVEMHNQQAEEAGLMEKLRAKKLAELGRRETPPIKEVEEEEEMAVVVEEGVQYATAETRSIGSDDVGLDISGISF
jgi:hypothetical protein